jgi:hypothetical protein
MTKKKGVFINREQIKDLILSIGTVHWSDFTVSDFYAVGNAQRCDIVADGKNAMLNLYFNNDGTTTITPVGAHTEVSTEIKVLLEENHAFKESSGSKTYSTKKVPPEWIEKLIRHLSSLNAVRVEQKEIEENPAHTCYRFISEMGDRLTVNRYKTGTLTLQGKPAYLYGEAISLLSYCDKISVDDIVDTVNHFHSIDVKTSDIRNEMKVLLPCSYGGIDDMVLKLLSPSISLRKVKIPLEDYSCYAFPALRALEGYIKHLLKLKNIIIGVNFGNVFANKKLVPVAIAKIGDRVYQDELERLYGYLVRNRHVLFHAEQVLVGTTVLDDKHEADEIVNDVVNLIETSYVNINK